MILTQGTPKEVGFNPEKFEQAKKTFTSWVDRGITPAQCILVARKGKIVLDEAYGISDPDSPGAKLLTDAIFPLSSLSKSFTAGCLLLLMEEGILDVSNPVKVFIPEFSGINKDDVTIHHILSHTSGIDDGAVWDFDDTAIKRPPVPDNMHPRVHERLYKIYNCPQKNEPGKTMHYCNSGYVLAAEIVRRITGKNISEYSKEKIFDLLGMTSTFYIVPESAVPRIVKRKKTDPQGQWLMDPEHLKTGSGTSGAFSNTQDIAVYCQMLLNKGVYNNKHIFSPRSVELMTQNQIPGISAVYQTHTFKEGSWSYGWNIRSTKIDDGGCYRSPQAISNGGGGGVYVLVDPVYNLIAVLFKIDIDHGINTVCNLKNLFNNILISAIDE